MSMEDSIEVDQKVETIDAPSTTESAAAPSTERNERKRPRLNLNAALGGDRKRGKGMLGLVLGTLNKAKIEDKERNASEAAKKRQLIEKRLQMKLRKETDSVRRAEEAKKDKAQANRKEEDLQLKDSIYKLRRRRLPILANFLLTSDVIPSDSSSTSSPNILAPPPRSHPPPLYYLPAILTPAQEAFLAKRKAEVSEATEKEWEAFKQERATGLDEIGQLRQKVADEEVRQKADRESMDTDGPLRDDAPANNDKGNSSPPEKDQETTTPQVENMEVDDSAAKPSEPSSLPKSISEPVEKRDEVVPMQADDDDAVEY